MCGRKGWTTQGAAIHASFGFVGTGWGNLATRQRNEVKAYQPWSRSKAFRVQGKMSITM